MGREQIDVANEQMKQLLDDAENAAELLTLKIESVVVEIEMARRIVPSIAWPDHAVPEEHLFKEKDRSYSVLIEIVNNLQLLLRRLRSAIQLIFANIQSLESILYKTDGDLDGILAASEEITSMVKYSINSIKEQVASLSEVVEYINVITFGTVSAAIH